jgi:hypothetical protein
MSIPTTFVPKETQPRPGGALFESEPRRVEDGQGPSANGARATMMCSLMALWSVALCEQPHRPRERRGCRRWAYGQHEDRTPTHGYEATREAAMAAFAKNWRRE